MTPWTINLGQMETVLQERSECLVQKWSDMCKSVCLTEYLARFWQLVVGELPGFLASKRTIKPTDGHTLSEFRCFLFEAVWAPIAT